MSEKLMKAFISEKSGNVISSKGAMMYANIITPGFPSKNERNEKKKQWALRLLIPADCDISVMQAEVKRVAEENLTTAQKKSGAKWVNPIKETAKEASLAQYAEEYPWVLSANTKCFKKDGSPRPRPDVIDNQGNTVPEIEEADACYNGRFCRIAVNPYWYDNENIGVSLGLSNVQLLGHGKPLAGGKVAASSDFEAVDDDALEDLDAAGDGFE